MLRPALIPAKGKHFVVADWSAIEGRVNPWLSGSAFGEAKLDVFRRKLDPYKVNAAATYSVAYEEVTGEQRQVGKVQELACFAAETKVLTSNGVKAIVDVQLTDLLWDGQSWVTHQGVICKGVRPTINVCGIEVTPDHLIKTKATWTQAQEIVSNKQLLTQALEVGSASLPYWALSFTIKAPAGCGSFVFSVIAALRRTWSTSITFSKANRRGATYAPKNLLASGEKIFTSMPMPAQMTSTAGACSTGYLLARTDATTPRIEAIQTMVAGGYIYMSPGALTRRRSSATLSRLMDGISRIWNSTVLTSIRAMSRAIYGSLRGKSIRLTNEKSETCNGTSPNLRPVYDILNSGSRNRFTVLSDAGPLIAHNCGFAGGVGAFAAMGRVYGVHFTEAQARKTVDAWRRANPWAVPFWQDLEEAYTRAMRNKGHEFSAGRVAYLFDGQHLWYALPSGRVLCYPYARLESDGVTYAKASWKPAADATEWPRARLWKGLACENITQAAANDILRHALRQLEMEGEQIVLHVHDEAVAETADPIATTERMRRVMTTPPAWAQDLPLNIEISTMSRYGKG
jgi:DNA polymerase